jgi:DNA-binding FrmR family transcriptional regulator
MYYTKYTPWWWGVEGERKANMLILKQHIHHFVKDAVKKVNGDEKINEIIEILHKIMNK